MNKFLPVFLLLLLNMGCKDPWEESFEKFTIPKGKHYSTQRVETLQNYTLTFEAYFDETAEYTTTIPENQWDINKLFGFSDCNAHHHEHSARFGWRWIDGKIEIMVYCYADGERFAEKIGETMPGEKVRYEIVLKDQSYLLRFKGMEIEIARKRTCNQGGYYLLFPYFGGDETAPHDIHVYIKRTF